MNNIFVLLVLAVQLPLGNEHPNQTDVAKAAATLEQNTSRSNIHEVESAVLQVIEQIQVPATAAGPLRQLNVKQGELIEAGQVLATIEDTHSQIKLRGSQLEHDIVAAQASSQHDIEFARKSQQVALADYHRAQESNRKYAGVVSDREMDRLKLLVEQNEAELEKLKFDKSVLRMQQQLKKTAVDMNRFELERHQIRATIAGQVVDIENKRGEWVNIADTIFKIARLDRLRVEEYLPATVATSQLLGAEASFFIQVGGTDKQMAEGKVVFVSPEIDPLNETVLVWIEFENRKLNLRPGLKGKVSIAIAKDAGKATASRHVSGD